MSGHGQRTNAILCIRNVELHGMENSPCPTCGDPLTFRSAKMSKSLGNTVSPELMIKKFGADTVRLFICLVRIEVEWIGLTLRLNQIIDKCEPFIPLVQGIQNDDTVGSMMRGCLWARKSLADWNDQMSNIV